jgi:hypothetical protein
MPVAWRLPDDLDAFRLGELVVVPHEPEPACVQRAAEQVLTAGYDALPAAGDWLHFRPRSAWWHGIGRHARLRDGALHLRLCEEGLLRFTGVLLARLERELPALGTVHRTA